MTNMREAIAKKAYDKAYYRRNQAKIKARAKAYRKKHKRDPEKQWHAVVKCRYGLSAPAYRALLEKQGGVCAVCAKPCATHGRLSVDHDHLSGKVRGLLCIRCNGMLGLSGDSPELLREGADYLVGWGK